LVIPDSSDDKEELLDKYTNHIRVTKIEHEYYNDNIKKAKENPSHIHSVLASRERPTPNTVDGKSLKYA